MVQVKEDLTNRVFGMLTVIKQVDDYVSPNGRKESQWLCECSCEERNRIVVRGDKLRRQNGTRNCGCVRKQILREFNTKNKTKRNVYDLSGEYGIGWTTNTNREFYFDLEDYDKIKDYCWVEIVNHNTGYHCVCTNIRSSTKTEIARMHWLIVGKYHDHENLNTFDNRKSNLRPATPAENSQNQTKQRNNTSGFIGVSWNKYAQKWNAYISINGEHVGLGYFVDKDDAIKARLQAEAKYYKRFAPQRHLFDKYGIENNNKGEI